MEVLIHPNSVFLAYSVRDKRIAEMVAGALERQDIPVWWDLDTIPVGADWEEFLMGRVSEAVCTIVLWSSHSIESKWVLREAEIALRRRVLIPVLIESVPIPEAFSRIQSASFAKWDGSQDDPAFQRLVKSVQHFMETAPSSADETRIIKQSQRSAVRRAEDLYLQNLRSETTLEHVDLENTAFYDQLNWNLTAGVNILLGRNGYGKTYLLRGILALLQYNDDAAFQTLGKGSGSISLVRDGAEQLIHFSDQYFDEEGAVGKIPVLAIPDMRFINRSTTTLGAVADASTGRGDRADLARHGASHFLEERPYEGMIQSFLYGLCLDYFERGLKFEGQQFELVRGVVRELTDSSFDFDRVAREGRDRFTLYVRTEGNESNPLPIQKASQGTTSVIAMFGLIYEFLKSLRQESTPDVLKRSGIVVIDEVDAHLHPSWQQRVVGLLRDRFPRVQFIITAHNPIVVAGCLEDEVSVLRKNPGHGFSLVQFPNDFVGWEMEAIYRKVFEIENPDDTFARFDAMRPFKGELTQKAAALAGQTTRSNEENRSLDEIEEKLLYIGKVEQARATRISQEDLERDNRTLRDRLAALESAHQSAREAQLELDRVRTTLAETQTRNRLVRRVLLAGIAVILVVLVALRYF